MSKQAGLSRRERKIALLARLETDRILAGRYWGQLSGYGSRLNEATRIGSLVRRYGPTRYSGLIAAGAGALTWLLARNRK